MGPTEGPSCCFIQQGPSDSRIRRLHRIFKIPSASVPKAGRHAAWSLGQTGPRTSRPSLPNRFSSLFTILKQPPSLPSPHTSSHLYFACNESSNDFPVWSLQRILSPLSMFFLICYFKRGSLTAALYEEIQKGMQFPTTGGVKLSWKCNAISGKILNIGIRVSERGLIEKKAATSQGCENILEARKGLLKTLIGFCALVSVINSQNTLRKEVKLRF
ncbi:hypothetical protein CEXT_152291 [Caerostris extrusa]|uniref:Uncharacterized protein n=1 Tax=Caerostris extrusa TaxID=172846 RepID=A0AAV4UVM2_CAEEX|nr:hypothetical protein CEXT_152291 [Caerostris extrusa]